MFGEAQALMAMNSHALTALEADFVRRLGYLLLRKVDRVAATALLRERSETGIPALEANHASRSADPRLPDGRSRHGA